MLVWRLAKTAEISQRSFIFGLRHRAVSSQASLRNTFEWQLNLRKRSHGPPDETWHSLRQKAAGSPRLFPDNLINSPPKKTAANSPPALAHKQIKGYSSLSALRHSETLHTLLSANAFVFTNSFSYFPPPSVAILVVLSIGVCRSNAAESHTHTRTHTRIATDLGQARVYVFCANTIIWRVLKNKEAFHRRETSVDWAQEECSQMSLLINGRRRV